MSPAELREHRRPHLQRRADLLGIGAYGLTILILLAFHAGPLPWGLVGWSLLVVFLIVFVSAARVGDDMSSDAVRSRVQEAEAREACRPHAEILMFPARTDAQHGSAIPSPVGPCPSFNESSPGGKTGAA